MSVGGRVTVYSDVQTVMLILIICAFFQISLSVSSAILKNS